MPAWKTVKLWPAMLSTPLRDEEAVSAATEKLIVALPSPLVAEVMVIQSLGLLMVQAQPAEAVSVTDPLPPPEGNEALIASKE